MEEYENENQMRRINMRKVVTEYVKVNYKHLSRKERRELISRTMKDINRMTKGVNEND